LLPHEPVIGPLEVAVSFVDDVDSSPSLAARNAPQINADWSRTLPRLNNTSLRSDDVISRLPGLFAEVIKTAVGQTLTGYSPQLPFQLRLISLQEPVNATPAAVRPSCVWARFRAQPDSGFCALELPVDFIISVIHQLLGGQEPIEIETRPLSSIEETILKFLCCDLVRQVNERLNAPVLQFENAGPVAPEWLREDDAALLESGECLPRVIAAAEIRAGKCWGFVHAHLTHQFVMQVTGAVNANPLLNRKDLRVDHYFERRRELFQAIVSDVTLAIVVGETDVTVEELRCLEAGDVVLISRPAGFWSTGAEGQSAQVMVSEGEAHFIRGRISASENGQLILTAANLVSPQKDPNSNNPEIDKMDHDTNGKKIFGEDGEALGGLLLTLHVQMAARRARLEELSQLRVGQVLQLGRTANDPVDLVIDGRRIAEGELVDIEGSLGVRVTEIAKP